MFIALLLLPLAYLIATMLYEKKTYLHFVPLVLYPVIYLIDKQSFYDGDNSNLFLLFFIPVVLVFFLKYARNKALYQALLIPAGIMVIIMGTLAGSTIIHILRNPA